MASTALKPIEQTMTMPPQWLPYQYYAPIDGQRTPIRVKQAAGEGQILVETPDQRQTVIPRDAVTREIDFRWENFTGAIRAMKYFPRYLANTLILCVLTVVGTVSSSALAAYGFSRVNWRGRDKVFLVALATMMIPFPVVMVPLYGLFRSLGWIGTLRPLWVTSFFAGAFNVFLMRQFFLRLPHDIAEAARIDGCSEFRIFWQITLPLARPVLMVVGLFQFMATWNDFLGPLIYLTDQKDFTLALGLQFFQSQQGGTEWNYLMAASVLIALPVMVLFFFTQKTFIEGISFTGAKG
jgi:multiple sugar transport system permease protein